MLALSGQGYLYGDRDLRGLHLYFRFLLVLSPLMVFTVMSRLLPNLTQGVTRNQTVRYEEDEFFYPCSISFSTIKIRNPLNNMIVEKILSSAWIVSTKSSSAMR